MPVLPALLLVLAVAPPLPPAPRSPAASATPAAQVVLVQGEVQLANGTKPIRVTRGTLLDRTDVVNVREGAWVALLLLNNGHVVRLDDELNIAVEKLALFKAGPVKDDPQAQLDRLLSTRERAGLGNERLIGWHQGLAAGNTIAAESAKRETGAERKRSVAADGFNLQGGEPSGGAAEEAKEARKPTRPASPPAEPASAPPPVAAAPAVLPRPPAPPPPPAGPAKRGSAEGSERPRPGNGRGQAPRGGGGAKLDLLDDVAEQRREPPAPAPLAVDPGLRQCVAQVAASLDPPVRQALGTAVKVRFRLSGDEVQVSTDGALPLPPCLVAWAEAHRAQLDPTWHPLLVPLQ